MRLATDSWPLLLIPSRLKPITRLLWILLLLLCITGAEFRKDQSGTQGATSKQDESTHPSPPPSPSPSGAPIWNNTKAKTPSPASPEVKNSSSVQSNDTTEETSGNQTTTQKVEDTEKDSTHCCGNSVRACLSSSGDSSSEMLLTIKSRDSVQVNIITPNFLSAVPSDLTTAGKEHSVRIEMIDVEAAKLQPSTNITIKSEAGVCELSVPSQSLGYSQKDHLLHRFDYSTVRSPVVGLSMLGLALTIVIGSWAFCRYRLNKHNRHSADADGPKYVELEMGNSHDDPPASEAAASSAGDDGWNEVWDEDWEESENVGSSSFRLSQSLSSKGLAARRTTKEGWAD